ncbi:GIY-YIG domain-containing protein [Flavobacterium longum]
MTRRWAESIPEEAGVYVMKENDKIVYVGETGNLQGRMYDLLDSRHHTVRRTIGEKLFSNEEGFTKATTRKKFPEHIEELVNNHICTNLYLAYLEVQLGRKELEEFIESDIEVETRLNKRGKRKKKKRK